MYDSYLSTTADPARDAFEDEMCAFAATLDATPDDELGTIEGLVLKELAAAQRDETELGDWRLAVAVAKAAELGERLERLQMADAPIPVPSTWVEREFDDRQDWHPVMHVYGYRDGMVQYWFHRELRESPEEPFEIYREQDLETFQQWYVLEGYQLRMAAEEELGSFERITWHATKEEADAEVLAAQERPGYQADRTFFWMMPARLPATMRQTTRFKSFAQSLAEIPF